MMKKLLLTLTALAISISSFAQSATVTLNPTGYAKNVDFDITIDYDAGDDGAGTDYTITSAKLQVAKKLAGGGFAGATFYTPQDILSEITANDLHAGTGVTITVDVSALGAIGTTADAAAEDPAMEYVAYIQYQTSGTVGDQFGGNDEVVFLADAAVDGISYNLSGAITQSASLTIPMQISTNVVIPAGGIKLQLWTISNPWAHAWRKEVNCPEIPIGANQSFNFTLSGLPAAITDGSGIIITEEELLADNPHAVSSPSSYSYQLRINNISGATGAGWTGSTPAHTIMEIDAALALGNNDNNDTAIYPNPTQGILNISELNGATSITITNLVGKTVKSIPATSTIDISELSSGVYIISTDKGLQRKILKQ